MDLVLEREFTMDDQNIVSKMNSFLHESAMALVAWLDNILPRVAETWWDDCVLNSLSYNQREIAKSKGFSSISAIPSGEMTSVSLFRRR